MKSLTKLLATGILASGLAFNIGCSKKEQKASLEESPYRLTQTSETQQSQKSISLDAYFSTKKSKTNQEYLDLNLVEDVKLRFVRIPGGEYPLDNGGVVTIKPFWMAETELTELQNKAIEKKAILYSMQQRSENKEFEDNFKKVSKSLGAPLEIVNENMEKEGLKKLERNEKDNYPFLTEYVLAIRLLREIFSKDFDFPNELQFYYALTEGNPIGFLERARPIYEKGNILQKDGVRELKPVKNFPPNVFGVYDLIGNAKELVYPLYGFNNKGEPILSDIVHTTGGSYLSQDQKEILVKFEAKKEHGIRIVINE